MTELEQQIAASRAGDREAFGRLIAQYQGLVCSAAYAVTGDLEKSEDVAQEAFVAAWRQLADLRDLAKFPAWVCGIARNLARGAARRERRDPLHRAAELDENQCAAAGDLIESLNRAQLETLMWRALEALPEQYREPMVMFYREGESVHAVAGALELTEDCVRQRLARGRRMLQGQVERVVEESLRRTRPGVAFTVAAMAALPVVAAHTAAAAGAGLAGKTAAGKSAAGVALTAGGVGALGGLAGALIGWTGGFFGMWNSIRNAPTLRTRRYMIRVCCQTYAFVWVFLGLMALDGVFFWRRPSWMIPLGIAGWALYIPLLLLLILGGNRRFRRIYEEDKGLRPASERPLEASDLSREALWRTFAWTFLLAVAGSAGTVAWLYAMPWSRALWPWFAAGVAVCHYAFAALIRWGVRAAHDEAAFAALPPRWSDPWAKAQSSQPSGRARFWNDFGALAGSMLGPMAPLVALAWERGDRPLAIVIVGVAIGAIALGMMMRRPAQRRRWGFFWIYIFMGLFGGAVVALKWQGWIEAGTARLPRIFGAWGGAIVLALYWCAAFAWLIVSKWQAKWQRRDDGRG